MLNQFYECNFLQKSEKILRGVVLPRGFMLIITHSNYSVSDVATYKCQISTDGDILNFIYISSFKR